jgi:hypothetical protein
MSNSRHIPCICTCFYCSLGLPIPPEPPPRFTILRDARETARRKEAAQISIDPDELEHRFRLAEFDERLRQVKK